jgi:fatty acid amide hydrolase 2
MHWKHTLIQLEKMFQLSSEDAVQAYVARIKEVNPYLNAVVEDRFEDAVREAQEVDRLVTSHYKTEQEIEKETPLLGVPFTVKESCSVKGCIKVKTLLFAGFSSIR